MDGKEHCFLVVTETIPVKRLVARVRCPVPGPPRSESWRGSGSAGRPVGVGRCIGFAVVMAQVRRPVPFRTRKLRPGTAMVLHSRGCGRVARRRIQLSGPSGRVPWGIPGRSFFVLLGVPVGRKAPGTPFFYALFCRPDGQRKLFGLLSACVSCVKALRLILWQELQCMILRKRLGCLPQRCLSPSGIPTK